MSIHREPNKDNHVELFFSKSYCFLIMEFVPSFEGPFKGPSINHVVI